MRLRRARLDSGHKLGRREGLDDVVVRPHLEGPGDEAVLAIGRHEDDRQVTSGHDVLHQVYSVDSRQHQVEEDQMGLLLLQKVRNIVGDRWPRSPRSRALIRASRMYLSACRSSSTARTRTCSRTDLGEGLAEI